MASPGNTGRWAVPELDESGLENLEHPVPLSLDKSHVDLPVGRRRVVPEGRVYAEPATPTLTSRGIRTHHRVKPGWPSADRLEPIRSALAFDVSRTLGTGRLVLARS